MSPRNRIIFSGFVLEKLQNHDDIADFDCGDPDLNEYFREDSVHYRAELLTQTYCYYREGGGQNTCVALVDFCNDSPASNFISNRDKRRISNAKRLYRSFPALKITRLGVSSDLHGKKSVRACLIR